MGDPTSPPAGQARDIADTIEDAPKRRVNEWWHRRNAHKRTTPPAPPRGPWTVIAVIALALLVAAIVVVGLRTSLGALRDAALAAHIEADAASLYWIGVDGLIVVAIIAALVLRHDPNARRYCLAVIGVFTVASGLLQYLHGLGWFTPDPVTGLLPRLPWGVVLVIAALVIGTIFCGTHLFVHALRRLFPGSAVDQREHPAQARRSDQETTGGDGHPDHSPSGDRLDDDTEREIRKWFAAITVGMLLDAGAKPVRAKIAREFEIAERQAGYVIADVIREREAAAERAEAERAAKAAAVTAAHASANGSGSGAAP